MSPRKAKRTKTVRKPKAIDESKLIFNDAPFLSWVFVESAIKLLWEDNPKLHDIGGVVQSIQKYGFQELPKFDKHVGIKAGNGRIEALAWMERDGNYELPRGLALDEKSGKWALPILFGTDADSLAMAQAYGLDSNNLTMAGGNFTAYDMTRQYAKDGYMTVLTMLAESGEESDMPVTADYEVLGHLSRIMPHGGAEPPEDFPDYDEEIETDYGCPRCGYEWSGDPR